jgi:hypothetical protein
MNLNVSYYFGLVEFQKLYSEFPDVQRLLENGEAPEPLLFTEEPKTRLTLSLQQK